MRSSKSKKRFLRELKALRLVIFDRVFKVPDDLLQLQLDGRAGDLLRDLGGLVDLVPERQDLVQLVLELVLGLDLGVEVDLNIGCYEVDVVLEVVEVPVLGLDGDLPLHEALVEDAGGEELARLRGGPGGALDLVHEGAVRGVGLAETELGALRAGVVEEREGLGEVQLALAVAETEELVEVEHGGHDGLLLELVVLGREVQLLVVDVGGVDGVREVELVPADAAHHVPVLHAVVVVQVPQHEQPVRVVVDADVLVVDQLVVQQQVLLVLREHHEAHAHAVLRLLRHVVLVDRRVLDVRQLRVQVLLLELELVALVRELVVVHADEALLLLVDVVQLDLLHVVCIKPEP